MYAILIPDSKVIGETKVFLNISKKKQTEMGNFLADAISHEVRIKWSTDVDQSFFKNNFSIISFKYIVWKRWQMCSWVC